MNKIKIALLDIPIETKLQARDFLRVLNKQYAYLLTDKEIKAKECEAFRFYRTGCRISTTKITYIKLEKQSNVMMGNCYEIIYENKKVGYVAQTEDGWLCTANYLNFPNINKGKVEKMRKIAVDKFLQNSGYS
ncbi:hypothetical protein CN449_14360 [Bacillus thuringiensis]|uniref:hypothetical protein n=1 Tax=Bacillus thuringiensis TaxID=1428 RepID=UPI000BF35BF7|nr:hypothetical protein [Bacillus thuringiensis]PEW74468.1 hypothetical protein CN449_14360 [Bacillus thuringiensis]